MLPRVAASNEEWGEFSALEPEENLLQELSRGGEGLKPN